MSELAEERPLEKWAPCWSSSPQILHHLKAKAAPLLPKGWDRSHGAPGPAEAEESGLLQPRVHLLLALIK